MHDVGADELDHHRVPDFRRALDGLPLFGCGGRGVVAETHALHDLGGASEVEISLALGARFRER